MSVENYLARARESDGPFLSMMNLSPSTLSGPRLYGPESFVIGNLAHRERNPSLKRRSDLANEIAYRTLFCDGAVYLAGGCPAFFGRRKEGEVGLEIGSIHAEKVGAIHCFLPGPGWREREEAACRSLVFLPSDAARQIQTLERRGLKVNLLSKVEGILELPSYPHPAEVCADAVARRAITRMRDRDLARMPAKLLTQLREAFLRPNVISSELCLEAIGAFIDLWPLDGIGLELMGGGSARTAMATAPDRLWRVAPRGRNRIMESGRQGRIDGRQARRTLTEQTIGNPPCRNAARNQPFRQPWRTPKPIAAVPSAVACSNTAACREEARLDSGTAFLASIMATSLASGRAQAKCADQP